ncbi:MAG: CHC2 zinc finger domain-containing protein [Armatimonadota bacterium]
MIHTDEIKRRFPILDVIGKLVALRRRGEEWWGRCPFHQDSDPSFHVSPEKDGGVWHCFGCGTGGDVISFVMRQRGVSFSGALRLLVGERMEDRKMQPVGDTGAWRRCLEGLEPLAGTPGEAYLQGRGIDPVQPVCEDVRYCAQWGWWKDKAGQYRPLHEQHPAVVFLLRDRQGGLVAAEGRYLAPVTRPGNTKATKANSVGPKRAGVFRTPDAFTQGDITICEGPIDALSMAFCNFPAVATCGAGNDIAWLPEACRSKKVILAFDPDPSGEAGMHRLAHDRFARAGINPAKLCPPEGDWNDYLRAWGHDAMMIRVMNAVFGIPRV